MERGPWRKTQAGGEARQESRLAPHSTCATASAAAAREWVAFRVQPGPVDDRDRHHPGDLAPAPPAMEAREVVGAHDPDEAHARDSAA